MDLKKILLKKLKTSIKVSFIFLVGCSCLPKKVEIYPKQILKRFNICNQYQIVNLETVELKFVKEISLEECLADGNFVIKNEELQTLRREIKEAKQCYDDNCRGPILNGP